MIKINIGVCHRLGGFTHTDLKVPGKVSFSASSTCTTHTPTKYSVPTTIFGTTKAYLRSKGKDKRQVAFHPTLSTGEGQ
jgi:hypothetical protein